MNLRSFLRVVLAVAMVAATTAVLAPLQSQPATAEYGLPAAGNSQRIAAIQKFSLGSHSTCVIRTDGYPVCWGQNTNNAFGSGWVPQTQRGDTPSEMGAGLPRSVPTSTTGAFYRRSTAVFAGGDQTCLLDTTSILRCTGASLNGSLGRSDGFVSASAGYSFGFNDSNIVNLGTGRSAVDVAPGGSSPSAGNGGLFNCALLDNGSVKCWGTNTDGQLGLGDNSNRGDQTGEMGDALPAVDLGTNVTATAIAAGSNFVCAIVGGGSVPAGSVKCWGGNAEGQLGQGDTSARGDGVNELGDSLPVVNIGTGRTAKMIVAGSTFACAIRDDNSTVCWGSNSQHQLGRGGTNTAPNNRIGDASGEMGDSLVAVSLGGGVAQLALGNSHACALLLDSVSVKCWGWNFVGQLGVGDTTARGSNTAPVSGLQALDLGLAVNETVSVVAAGTLHSCVYTSTEQVKCWGGNNQAQLGIGQATSVLIGDAANEMGANLVAADYSGASPTEVTNIVSTSTATSVTLSWDPPSHSFGTITAYEASCGSRGSFGGAWNGTNTGWTSLGLQQTVTVTSTMYGNVASEGLIECFIRARTISGTNGEGLSMRGGRRAGIPLAVTASSHTVTSGAAVPTITGSPSVNGVSRTSETCSTTYTQSSPAGSYPTTCSGGTATGYSIDYVAGVITVVAPLTVTASSHSLTAGAAVPTITGTPSVNGVSRTGETCSTTYTQSSPAGSYPTTCSGGTAAGYSITYVAGSITAVAAPTTTSTTVAPLPTSTAPASGGVSVSGTGPSLVTSANQSALTAMPGKASVLVNGVAVTPQILSASGLSAAQTNPEERTPAQIRELQQTATLIENRLDAVAGGESGISVVRTDSGAALSGIFSGTRVPIEDVVVVSASNTATLFAARDIRGNVIEVKPGAVIEVDPNGDVAVQAYGLRAGEGVELVVMSTPRLLGKFTVSSNGTIKTTAKLPSVIGNGNHTLVVASPSVKASLGLKLVKSKGNLPVTGTSTSAMTSLAVLLLASGAYVMLFVVCRRRNNRFGI